MSAQRMGTAPLEDLADVVTNSLRPDVPSKTIGFSSGPPPGNRAEREPSPPKRIFVTATFHSLTPILSGSPL
jgi:hypothetical protein